MSALTIATAVLVLIAVAQFPVAYWLDRREQKRKSRYHHKHPLGRRRLP